MIDYNRPGIAEDDGVLLEALYLHPKGLQKEIHFYTHNLFRSNGLTVQKSRLPLFHK